jgi:hypothetical protein
VNIDFMPERSDLSGNLIEADSACSLNIRFPDGRHKEFVVRLDEAEELAAKGRDPPTAPLRIGRSASGAARAIAKWALLSLVGVLVVQALIKQWSDRQKELELKTSLASDIGTSAHQAFAEARTIAYLPKSEHRPARKLVLLTAWISDEGRIDATFRSYLKDEPATDEWVDFRDALYSYLLLACCQEPDDRQTGLDKLTDALQDQGSTVSLEKKMWHTLYCGPHCDGYAEAYDSLGLEILKTAPYRTIEASHPKGFSDGFRDFMHDAIPGY